MAYGRRMTRTARALLWALGAVVALLLGVLALGSQTVSCASPFGSGGECVREPSLEQSIVMAVICAGAAVYCGWRAVRNRRARS